MPRCRNCKRRGFHYLELGNVGYDRSEGCNCHLEVALSDLLKSLFLAAELAGSADLYLDLAVGVGLNVLLHLIQTESCGVRVGVFACDADGVGLVAYILSTGGVAAVAAVAAGAQCKYHDQSKQQSNDSF